MAEPNQFLHTHRYIDYPHPSASDLLRTCISIFVLYLNSRIALFSQHDENSPSLHMRGWREAKRIAKVLFAPELIIVQAFTRISDANEDLQAVRELGQDWDLGLAFMANSGRINLRDDIGRTVALPRPAHLLANPQAHLWGPIIKIIRQSTVTSSSSHPDGVVFLILAVLLLPGLYLSRFVVFFGGISIFEIHALIASFCTLAANSISWW